MSYIGNSPGVASQRVTTTLTATAAQTQFTTQSGYVLGYVDVYLNGAKLINGTDFEAITGTYITLFAGAASGDVVELISYVPRGLTDGYTKAEADSKFLDVGGDTATGNLAFATATLSGNLTLNGGTANGVGYLNASKVVTTGSALTFDGTILATPTLNLTNALGVAYGGTGQTTANASLNALLPTQTGNATKYLQTDGTNTTWDAISISTADITGTLPLANGGTGATTAAGALTSLGAYAATNPSGYTTNLGTVTSVAASVPAFLSISGSPITTSGTLAITLSGTALPTTSGGTGLTSFTSNGLVYATSTSALTTGSALTFDGTYLTLGATQYLRVQTTTARANITVDADLVTENGLGILATSTTYGQGYQYIRFFNSAAGYAGSISQTASTGIGLYSGSDLIFGANIAERMRLTSTSLYTASGISVGIGTSNPNNKLTIEADATGVAFADNGVAQLVIRGTSNTAKRLGMGVDTTNNIGVIQAQLYGSSTYPLALNPLGGNVGIGTGISSPAQKLQVEQDSANPTVRILRTGYGYTDLVGGTGGSGNDFKINMNGTDRLYIESSTGNVSIASTVSRQKLHVKGRFNSDLNDDYYGLWGEGNTAASGYSFLAVGDWYSSSLYIQKQTGNSFAHIYTHNSSHHVLLQGGSGDNGTTSASGNVYIGTTTNTNSSKLVVAGTISQTVGGTQYLVVDQSDVGTAPNQIPLNQYLGSMAFQDRENINFTGGTGALSSLDIAAISAQLNVNATDLFIYDTSKDSDGGAWRKRTQHTSWYNETLNTATRGSRRDFPAVAVLVATTTALTIYDGDAPDLPMWMVFNNANYTAFTSTTVTGNGAFVYPIALTSVCAINGTIATGAQNYQVLLSNLISDTNVLQIGAFGSYIGGFALYSLPISGRNSPGIYTRYSAAEILESGVNDVAITVLPNAPIDPATGLPIPTIAVATNIGVSVIKDTGTVVNIVPDTLIHDTPRNIYFTPTNELWYTGGNNYDPSDRYFHIGPIPATSVTQDYDASSPAMLAGFRRYAAGGEYFGGGATNGAHLFLPYDNLSPRTGSVLSVSADTLFAAGKGSTDNGGVAYIYENKSAPTTGMIAHITSNYSTGWMHGNIKGAWLSDTAQETVVGAQLIPNGTSFAGATGTTPPTGWNSTGASYTASANVLSITCSANSNAAAAILLTGLIPGKTYQLSMDASAGGYFRVFGTNHDSVRSISGTRTTQVYNIVTTSTALDININYGSGSATGTLANVSLRLTDVDRSVNAAPLLVYGTVTKTPVAAGSDLVGYSGWGSGKYLYSPLSTAYSLGSGDFSLTMWIKPTQANTGYIITQNIGIRVAYNSAGALRFHVYGNAGTPQFIDSTSVSALNNIWHQGVFVRRNGKLEIYINGVLSIGTIHSNQTETFSNATDTFIGVSEAAGGSIYTGELALMRLSATVPSQEQITKMYNDEKYLFQENSKATLYGTSDAVTALAYDTDTQLLHVGTSSGRSVFDGLRRVENTTTAVTAAISAVDGLVVEN